MVRKKEAVKFLESEQYSKSGQRAQLEPAIVTLVYFLLEAILFLHFMYIMNCD